MSRPFHPHHLLPALERRYDAVGPRRFAIALSGGLDSAVLMHAVHRCRAFVPAATFRVLHIDHGLQPDSAKWAASCGREAAALGLAFEAHRVTPDAGRRTSPEASARTARYDRLVALLARGEVLLTAHHRNDQLETVLIQLLRGAGVAGLAAMPDVSRLGEGWLVRPLLDVPRAALEAWACETGIRHLEDPSNRDLRYDRNFVRHRIVPLLEARWPGAGGTIARSAELCAEAAGLLREQAEADLVGRESGDRLVVEGLVGLPLPRARNALRQWIRQQGFPVPSRAKLEHLISDVVGAGASAAPLVTWARTEVRRYRGELFIMAPLAGFDASRRIDWDIHSDAALGAGLGTLQARPASGRGLSLARLEAASLTVGVREGGERIRPDGQVHHRPLKKLMQEAGIVPWMRDRIPLVRSGDNLVAVADLWWAAEFAAEQGEAAVLLGWSDHRQVR